MASLDGNDAVLADFTDDVGDHFANFFIASGDGRDFGDFLVVTGDFFGFFVDFFDDFRASFLNSLPEFLGEDGDSGGAIASNFVELLGGGLD